MPKSAKCTRGSFKRRKHETEELKPITSRMKQLVQGDGQKTWKDNKPKSTIVNVSQWGIKLFEELLTLLVFKMNV